MKHVSLFKYILSRSAFKYTAAFIAAGLILSGPVLASGESSIPAVGQVTFVLGKPYLETSDGARHVIVVGTSINVNDRIETGSNGHVHIRFVDNELVSVRPSSQLEILRYDYDAAAPENSVVKLNLIDGVTRAISGEAAKAARQNFRMDTPIAAIGVRGTDFVVSSNRDGVTAHVNEGAIIIAPYSSECSAAAFGPCSQNAVELAGGANQIVQISANTNEAMLLSLAGPATAADPVAAPTVAAVEASSEPKTKDEALYKDSVTSKAVTLALVDKNAGPAAPPAVAPPAPVEIPEFTPAATVSDATLTAAQLVWGRWYDSTSELERITVSRTTAKAGREITVSDYDDVYALYRTANNSDEVQRGLGALGFNLNQAQAVLKSNGQSDLMNVTGGVLNIDFDKSRYSTSLQMNHEATGNIEFNDSGRIFPSGIFHSNTQNGPEFLAGAISMDGTEAGYLFEKTLQSGIIEGLTLWGVKP